MIFVQYLSPSLAWFAILENILSVVTTLQYGIAIAKAEMS